MSQKQTKTNHITTSQKLETMLSHAALGAMALAAMVSNISIPEDRTSKALPILQPAYAITGAQGGELNLEGFDHHERLEEIRHQHASYGSTMRSHPTARSI